MGTRENGQIKKFLLEKSVFSTYNHAVGNQTSFYGFIFLSTDCKKDEFFCSSDRKCISKMQMCDTERQCSGGEDEVLENCEALGLVSVGDV